MQCVILSPTLFLFTFCFVRAIAHFTLFCFENRRFDFVLLFVFVFARDFCGCLSISNSPLELHEWEALCSARHIATSGVKC